MEVNQLVVAQYLMDIRNHTSHFSKKEWEQIFGKLFCFIADINDLTPMRGDFYESRSNSAYQLGKIVDLLSSESGPLGPEIEKMILLSIIEVTVGSLSQLTDKKIEAILDIFVQYYYKGASSKLQGGILECSYILEKLEKSFDLKTKRKMV